IGILEIVIRSSFSVQKIAFWATSTLIFCLFICGIASAWPTNVLSDSQVTKSIKEIFAETFPQGWSYFTKSSQELKAGVYDGATIESLLATPQARRENLYGISRDQRAQGPEIAMLVANTDLEWEECSGISQDCLREASQRSPVRVDNIA